MRTFLIACTMTAVFVCIPGCSNKEQPFKEGWAAERYRDYIPEKAQIVAEGTGKLTFTPTTYGTLYLLDLDDMVKVKELLTPHVVVTGAPLPGPAITFDPATATISREGKTPQKLTKITNGHKYQLRWMPDKSNEN